MADTPRTKLFISYARKDGRTLALRLQASLSSNYDVWLDTSEIEGGASWGSEIERAIDDCQTVIALLSAGSYQSEICRAEQLRGLRKGKRVVPVLVQANAERPIWLEGLIYRDFSDELAYDAALTQLLVDLSNGNYTAPIVRIAPNTAPGLPAHFVPRPEAIDDLRKAIISDATDRHVALTALHGMGGIGKSVIAAALCYDPAIQDAFPDGIFWIEIGREPSDLIEKMKVIGTKLGDAASNYTSKDLAVSSLRQLLVRKSVLIVLDDVWDRAAIEPFLANSPQSRWLVTTRDGHIATALGAAEVRLGTLTKDQAHDLLRGWAEHDDPKYAEIAEALGYHPLAIKLVGARLRDGMSGQEWLDSYHSIAQIKLGRRPTHTDESLQLCFDVSIDRLQSDDRPLYHALGIFPEDEWIPEGVVARLWRKLSPDLSAADCADILLELDKLALIDRDIRHHEIRMHDLLHSYNREALSEKYQTVQADFVAAHPDLRALPDSYTWHFIGYHLIESGQANILRSLLLDYRYLRSKLGATDVNALQADCDLMLKRGKDESIRVLRSALSMSAHVLREDADALGHQLVGRIMGHRKNNPELRVFTDGIPAQQPGLYPVDFDSEYVTHDQAGGTLLATLSGHTGGVNGALVLNDGRILSWARGLGDTTLRLWATDGTPLAVLEGHTDRVNGALALADGRFLSWSDDKTLRLWAADGTLFDVLAAHTEGVTGALALEDGRVLSWSKDHSLRLWSGNGLLLYAFEGHFSSVIGVLKLDINRILSYSADGELRLWNLNSMPLKTFRGHKDKVNGILKVKGERLLSWSNDKTLHLWGVNGELLNVMSGHTAEVNAALELGDGRFLSWSIDSTIKLWAADGKYLTTFTGHKGWINGVRLVDDNHFLSWSDDGTLRLWNLETLKQSVVFTGHHDGILGVQFLGDQRFLSYGWDGKIHMWTLDGKQQAIYEGHTKIIVGGRLLSDGRFLSWSRDATLRLWTTEHIPLPVSQRHSGELRNILALADKHYLSWCHDQTPRLWNSDGLFITTLTGHTNDIQGVIPVDNGCCLSWSMDKSLRLWSPQGNSLAVFTGHTGNIYGALNLTGGRFLSWSEDKTLRLWSASETPAILAGHTAGVIGALILANRRFVSWGNDNSLLLWTPEGTLIKALKTNSHKVNGAVALVDGRFLTWSRDKFLRLWAADGAPLAVFTGHNEWVRGALLLNEGTILSWSNDNSLRLWAPDGQSLHTFIGHSGAIIGALPLSDNRFLSWSWDKTMKLWDAKNGTMIATLSEDYYEGDRYHIFDWGEKYGINMNRVLPDTQIAAGSLQHIDQTLTLYSSTYDRVITQFQNDSKISALIASTNGDLVAAGDAAGRVLFLRWRDR